jgi:hypothetical protein
MNMQDPVEVKELKIVPKPEPIGQLATALALAQGEIEGAKKDANNPFFHSKYADLASVWDACRTALSKNGLAVVQIPGMSDDGRVTVKTILMHKSGESIDGVLSVKPIYIDKDGKEVVCNDPQGIGSAITYARRYALAAFVGVAPEDDDGNKASGRTPLPPAPPPYTPPKKPTTAQKKADEQAKAFEATNDRIFNKIVEKRIPKELVQGKKEELRMREYPNDYTPARLAEFEAWVDDFVAQEPPEEEDVK